VKHQSLSEDTTEANLNPLYARFIFRNGMVSVFRQPLKQRNATILGETKRQAQTQNTLHSFRKPHRLRNWMPMMFVTNASQLILLLVIQALLGSMATPAWTALIGDMVPSFKLGRTNATINLWASFGSLIATLSSGIIMISVGGTIQEIFFYTINRRNNLRHNVLPHDV